MAYSLSIEPYKTDRSDFRITLNRAAAKRIVTALYNINHTTPTEEGLINRDLADTIDLALERWK